MQHQMDVTDDDSLFDYGDDIDGGQHESLPLQRPSIGDRAHSTSVKTEIAHSSPLLSEYGFESSNHCKTSTDNNDDSESESD